MVCYCNNFIVLRQFFDSRSVTATNCLCCDNASAVDLSLHAFIVLCQLYNSFSVNATYSIYCSNSTIHGRQTGIYSLYYEVRPVSVFLSIIHGLDSKSTIVGLALQDKLQK